MKTLTQVGTGKWATISAGEQHSLALDLSGKLHTWGYNWHGQLGAGTRLDKHTPIPIGKGTWKVVVADGAHSLAIDKDDRLFTWGHNRRGQLGDGTTENKYTPTPIGTGTWKAVAAGYAHSLGLTMAGELYAWGENANGQLGDGTREDRHTPTRIGTCTWAAVVAGYAHSLGITTDGKLYVWGLNGHGQLGDGTRADRHTPTQIGTGVWAVVSAGDAHSLGITTDGKLYAWGRNSDGQLGDGTTADRHVPTQMGTDTWKGVAAGNIGHSLGITTDGRLYAWGRNSDGQLGDGTLTDRHVPTQIGTGAWKDIAAGYVHSIAIDADGKLYGWGRNWRGQLGDGTTEDRHTPPPEDTGGETWTLPPTDMFNRVGSTDRNKDEAQAQAKLHELVGCLASFNVRVDPVGYQIGATVIQLQIRPQAGVTVRKVQARLQDAQMALEARTMRIEAPAPGKNHMTVELPRENPQPVLIGDLLATDEFCNHKSSLAFAVGTGVDGRAIIADLAKMPHMLIAGSTGSGKSVAINSLIASLLVRNTPETLCFTFVDPKIVELGVYKKLPHCAMRAGVITGAKETKSILGVIRSTMNKNYEKLAAAGCRNITEYLAKGKKMRHHVVIIDELADLMLSEHAKDTKETNEWCGTSAVPGIETLLCMLAQKARAAGIHLVLATQTPRMDILTGVIKANFPSKIALTTSTAIDSRIILDQGGAEALNGRGDMLCSFAGGVLTRVQGCYVSDTEINELIRHWKKQR